MATLIGLNYAGEEKTLLLNWTIPNVAFSGELGNLSKHKYSCVKGQNLSNISVAWNDKSSSLLSLFTLSDDLSFLNSLIVNIWYFRKHKNL